MPFQGGHLFKVILRIYLKFAYSLTLIFPSEIPKDTNLKRATKKRELEADAARRSHCGECKSALAERVKRFLRDHQRRRKKARDVVEKFFIK